MDLIVFTVPEPCFCLGLTSLWISPPACPRLLASLHQIQSSESERTFPCVKCKKEASTSLISTLSRIGQGLTKTGLEGGFVKTLCAATVSSYLSSSYKESLLPAIRGAFSPLWPLSPGLFSFQLLLLLNPRLSLSLS